MAIAFDAVSAGTFQVTTWNHTMGAGANGVLVVGAFDDNGGSNLMTAIDWNAGEGLTKIGQVQVPGDRWVSLWRRYAPTAGTHTITLTTTASAFRASAISLTGVGVVDTFATGTASSTTAVSANLTAAASTWLVSFVKENAGITFDSWTNITEDAGAAGNGIHMGTSRGNVSGSVTSTATFASGGVSFAEVMATFTTAGAGASRGLFRDGSSLAIGAGGSYFQNPLQMSHR